MQVLRSLIDGLTKVVRGILDFIGTIWSRIYKYVGSQIKPILSTVQGLAQQAFNSAVAYVNKFLTGIYKRITDVYNDARHFVITQVATAVTVVKNFAQSLIRGVQSIAQGAVALANQISSWARGQVSAILANISTVWNWVDRIGNATYNIVKSWLGVFTADNLSRFVYLVVNLFPSIFNFFKDPVAFVTLWLEPMLLDMIYWLLAYDLGTKEASLPDKPKNYG
jgi:phage-related protein